ncbi:hypothetical protein [Frondihabitans sp. 762G35]|uniref:hypothetical protein n=1 Tax=Frondihabitans sp. 762G35 TaxID=1446794 RepID=UPI000F4DC14C|nr:hypothetical protein [Frondihabitans sp. 762G35]
MTSDFFRDIRPRQSREAEYLTVLRAAAARWKTDVKPEDTLVETFSSPDPLMVAVAVQGIAGSVNALHVFVQFRDDRVPILRGGWGQTGFPDPGDYVFGSPHELKVRGLSGTPDLFASLAATWLEEQLLRPVFDNEFASPRSPMTKALAAPGHRFSRAVPKLGRLARSGGYATPR